MEGHRIGVLLWICVCVLDGVAGSCPDGTYGYQCGYRCNCLVASCDTSDGCKSQSCNTGWSGPTCQQYNKALNKPTSASTAFRPPNNAVNGNTRADNSLPCFHSTFNDIFIKSAWWRVDLGERTAIHDVTIYFRKDLRVRRNGIRIYIADTDASPTDGVNCYYVTGNRDGTDIPDVLRVSCPGKGRYLVLYTATVNNEPDGYTMPIMDFCEVEVDVCSPGTFGADCDKYCHCVEKVCDHVSGVCPGGVCRPGWATETCETVCYDGQYGANCSNSCQKRNCKGDNSSCNHVTGECIGGCGTGWNGADCSHMCYDGQYGANCSNSCLDRNCKGDNSSCDHVTGECVRGCMARWNGIDCTQKMPVPDTTTPTGGKLSPTTTGVIGVAVGTGLTVILGIVLHVCLVRQGRLMWIGTSQKDEVRDSQGPVDKNITQASDYTSVSEVAHDDGCSIGSNYMYVAVDVATKADSDIIEDQIYQEI